MADILPFKRPTPPDRADGPDNRKEGTKSDGRGLCRAGFHKWEPVADLPFMVKQGRLVTLYRCARCGATRTMTR